MTKKEKARRIYEVGEVLKQLYPNAECALQYRGDPWRLFVMGRLSAQCTDKRVNIVSEELFRVLPDAYAMASADIALIEALVKPCGLYRTKADNLKKSAQKLIDEYDGVLPREMEALLSFPGVGRKIANLLRGDLWRYPGVVTDTHCIRICGRLGMYPESETSPEKTEKILSDLISAEEQTDFCHRIVSFGREYCMARSPRCHECPLSEKGLCPHGKKARQGKDKNNTYVNRILQKCRQGGPNGKA